MTFSLIARCPLTGQIGGAVTTSSIAVGSRCLFVAPRLGAVLTQHRTDPRLGPRGLGLLRSGCNAAATIAALVASSADIGWRQLAVLDPAGRTAHHHGARVKPEHGAAHGDAVVAIGNILSSDKVPAAMVAAFAAASGTLAERLLIALEGGEAAGGEHGEVTSAALLVYDENDFPFVDLRVDYDLQPLVALRSLLGRYLPLAEGFISRALYPDDAPVI